MQIILELIIVIVAVVTTIYLFAKKKTNTIQIPEMNQQIQIRLPYHKKTILTKNEYYFYKRLKPIAEKYGLQILTKIRLADLIEVNQGMTRRDWNIYFSKIKSKHIDFAIADDMKIVLIIELDDNSHQRQDRLIRDMFVDDALRICGYYILHTYGNTEMIDKVLNDYKATCTKY